MFQAHLSDERPQARGSFRLRGPTPRPQRWTCKTPSVLAMQAPRPHTRTNQKVAGISHPAWAYLLTWFLCWSCKLPGPRWVDGDKSKSLEQETWDAERREVNIVRGEESPSRQPAEAAGAGAYSGLSTSQLAPKPVRGPGTQFWAVSKDKFSTSDLIVQNSPRASERSGQHHFDKLENGRHYWSHNIGGGTGVLPSARQRGAGAGDGLGVAAGSRLGKVPETSGMVSWCF